MNKGITVKLYAHLSASIDTEPDVMYLLAQCRKLLDRDKPRRKPFALWMYCHWALHVDLEKTGTTADFLRRVDEYVTNNFSGFTGTPDYVKEDRLLRDFVYLEGFRAQLRDLLNSYGLPMDLCDEDKRWFAFIAAYAGLIEDGTLSSKSKKTDGLIAVETVTFSKGQTLSSEYHVPFTIQWDILLKDGRTVTVEGDATPSAKQMSFITSIR